MLQHSMQCYLRINGSCLYQVSFQPPWGPYDYHAGQVSTATVLPIRDELVVLQLTVRTLRVEKKLLSSASYVVEGLPVSEYSVNDYCNRAYCSCVNTCTYLRYTSHDTQRSIYVVMLLLAWTDSVRQTDRQNDQRNSCVRRGLKTLSKLPAIWYYAMNRCLIGILNKFSKTGQEWRLIIQYYYPTRMCKG